MHARITQRCRQPGGEHREPSWAWVCIPSQEGRHHGNRLPPRGFISAFPLYLAQQPLPPCGNVSLCKPDGCPWVRADRSADQPGLSSHHISGYSLTGPPAGQQLSGETGRVNHSWGGHPQVCSLKLSRLLQKAQGAEAALCSCPRTLAQVHGVSVKRKFICFCSWSVLKVIKVMILTSCLLFYWQLTCQEINFLPLLYVSVPLSMVFTSTLYNFISIGNKPILHMYSTKR